MNILLATDGSSDSHAALDLLKQFHWREEDRVHVLTVVETLVLFTGRIDDPADGGRKKLMDEEGSAAREVIEKAAAALRPHFPHVHTRLHVGFPAREILDAAGEVGADLIVVGSRGKSALREFFMGSVSRSVIDTAGCSVLVARPEVEGLLQVVLGYDGSPEAEAALGWLRRLPFPEETRVEVVSVAEPVDLPPADSNVLMPAGYPSVVAALRERSCRRAGELAGQAALTLKELPLTIEERACEEDPLQGLLESVREHGADLAIVGAHSKRGWLGDLIGNTALGLLRHCPCSVLVARAGVAKKSPWWSPDSQESESLVSRTPWKVLQEVSE